MALCKSRRSAPARLKSATTACLIADSSTLTGVNRNVKIDIDESAGADNTVTLDLGTQAVEKIYADLGDGTNSLSVTGGSAKSFQFDGGSGADTVSLTTPVSGYADVKLGNGDNSLTVNGTVGNLVCARRQRTPIVLRSPPLPRLRTTPSPISAVATTISR